MHITPQEPSTTSHRLQLPLPHYSFILAWAEGALVFDKLSDHGLNNQVPGCGPSSCAASSNPRGPGRLRVSEPRREAHLNTLLTLISAFSIVLIPGIGTTSPENWPFASRTWLATLPDAGDGARILAYEYPSPFTIHNPSCESLLMLGYDLLQHLNDVRSQADQSLASVITPEFFLKRFICRHTC